MCYVKCISMLVLCSVCWQTSFTKKYRFFILDTCRKRLVKVVRFAPLVVTGNPEMLNCGRSSAGIWGPGSFEVEWRKVSRGLTKGDFPRRSPEEIRPGSKDFFFFLYINGERSLLNFSNLPVEAPPILDEFDRVLTNSKTKPCPRYKT